MLIRTHYSSQIKPEDEGKEVVIAGWVHRVRDLGGVKFIILRDREGLIQVTIKKGLVSQDLMQIADELKEEYVITVKGIVKSNKIAPKGREVIPSEIEIINKPISPLPISISSKTEIGLDTRLDYRVLDLRRPEVLAIFKIQSKIVE
ncbi:MAG: OB-fold nucleic acid binding domain-containing protein, partial [Candidatus Methanomethyliaceae archaeon]